MLTLFQIGFMLERGELFTAAFWHAYAYRLDTDELCKGANATVQIR